ncbi:MAG: hypothetical protein IJV39_01070 [Ruminococcus sp.]|nr:hypothetical protein [Ruminococcus sp.]
MKNLLKNFGNIIKSNNIVVRALAFLMIFVVIACGSIGFTVTQAHAVVGEIAAGALLIIGGLLVSFGLTFSTQSLLQNESQAIYEKLPDNIQHVIDNKAKEMNLAKAELSAAVAMEASWYTEFTAEELAEIYDAVKVCHPEIFGIEGSDGLVYSSITSMCGSLTTIDKLEQLYKNFGTLSVTTSIFADTYTSFALSSNINIDIMSTQQFENYYSQNLADEIHHTHNIRFSHSQSVPDGEFFDGCTAFIVYTIPGTLLSFVAPASLGTGGTIDFFYNDGNPIMSSYFSQSHYTDFFLDGCWIFAGELCNATCVFSSAINDYLVSVQSPTYGKVCDADGSIFGSDVTLGKSICPDGFLRRQTMVRWLLGDDVVSPSASVPKTGINDVYTPANDTYWKDVVGNPSDIINYPYSIPYSPGKTISIPVPKIRSKDAAKDTTKDAAKDTTKDTTKDPDEEKTDDNNKKSTSIPKVPLPSDMTIPEIIFKRKFPFCLPYDLYNVFAQFNRDNAEAPVFEFPFKFTRLNINYKFKINMAEYKDIINISKFFTNAGFVVFLIIVSRKMIGAQ